MKKLILKFIDLVVLHSEEKSFYKSEVETILDNPEHCFEKGKYKYEERPNINKLNKNLYKYFLNDFLIGDQYLIPYKEIKDKEILWHWLSVFVGNNDIPNIRQHLTSEIYDNSDYVFDIKKSSLLFKNTDYLIYGISLVGIECIGTIKREYFQDLTKLCSELDIEIEELK